MGRPRSIVTLLVLAVAASQVASAYGQLSLLIFTERGALRSTARVRARTTPALPPPSNQPQPRLAPPRRQRARGAKGWDNVAFLKDAMAKLGVRADVREYWRGMTKDERPDIRKLMRTPDGAGPAYAGFAM